MRRRDMMLNNYEINIIQDEYFIGHYMLGVSGELKTVVRENWSSWRIPVKQGDILIAELYCTSNAHCCRAIADPDDTRMVLYRYNSKFIGTWEIDFNGILQIFNKDDVLPAKAILITRK